MSNPEEFTIFYSWQSDSERLSNQDFIRRSLRSSTSKVELERPYVIKIDEATSNMPGSPDIPSTIRNKIDMADLFVADVTTVGKNLAGTRSLPNPNVVFELGYAVATLGWGRVVLLLNTKLGNPKDLPFDFDRNRATPYAASNSPKKGDDANLIKELRIAILAVIDHNPERPSGNQSPEQVKRSRDVKILRKILSTIHIPTFEYHTSDLPHRIHEEIFYYWKEFSGVMGSNLFYIYDLELKNRLHSLHDSFKSTVSNGDCYQINNGVYIYSVNKQMDSYQSYLDIERSAEKMKESLDGFLSHVHENYLEINIVDESARAFDKFKRSQQGIL